MIPRVFIICIGFLVSNIPTNGKLFTENEERKLFFEVNSLDSSHFGEEFERKRSDIKQSPIDRQNIANFDDNNVEYMNRGLQPLGYTIGEDEEILAVPDAEFSNYNSESGNHEDEETFASGVLSINELSKDEKHHTSNKKKKKEKKKEEIKNKFVHSSSGIDLKYLKTLFENRNINEFQTNQSIRSKKKAFKTFQDELYNNNSHELKLLERLDSKIKNSTKNNLQDSISRLLKEEESSIRYKISFPLFYHSVGTITMPYDDLVEPFEAWYAGELNMSRIDYYQGMDKSYQRGDIGKNGVVVKLTPAHWGKKSDLDRTSISCWYKEDSKWTNRRGQTVVPLNVKKFKYVGKDRFNGVPTHKFTYEKRFVDKNNTYTLHITQSKPYKPLRYEMVGYDHLLRSHYDHYIIDYFSFDEWEFDYKVLQIPKKYKCYKKLEKLKSHFEANPMWEFLHGEHVEAREIELNKAYNNYQKKHLKSNKNFLETHKRKDIFRHNSRFIHSHNRAQLNYTLDVNHLSDISEEEFEMLKGQSYPDTPELRKELDDIPQLRISIPKSPLPKSLDWREYGAVGRVHSQTFCASCWAFSAVGAIEGAYAIKNGSIEEFSVQQLIDCSWGYENNGCRGGWSWRAFQFVKDHGLATRSSYGKYMGQEGYCHCGKKEDCKIIDKISYKTIEKHNAKKLKVALAMYGPGSIAVQCARKTFKFYSSGIYDDPKCTKKTDHAVLVIGYGEEKGTSYWLIKNSWGNLWGDHGFMKISMKNDLCGVLNNGPLMVSVGGWGNNTSIFPFERLKKHENDNTVDHLKGFNKLQENNEGSDIDLFVLPDHVTSYIIKTKS